MRKLLLPILFTFITALLITGCVNYDQKTELKSDGSGTMKIHYWASSSNISDNELGGFGFNDEKARKNFTSTNTTVDNVKIEEKADTDTTKSTHVYLDLKFKDINKLSEAKGFEKIKATYEKSEKGMEFKYTLLKDTANSGFGMEKYTLTYEFNFPDEVLATNGNLDGKKVSWSKNLTDLKEDVLMSATIKGSGKKCGLFGIELPIVVLVGSVLVFGLKRKK